MTQPRHYRMKTTLLVVGLGLLWTLSSALANPSRCADEEYTPAGIGAESWQDYRCLAKWQTGNGWSQCLRRTAYSDTAGTGCQGAQRCCPESVHVSGAVSEDSLDSAETAGAILFAIWLFGWPTIFMAMAAFVIGLFTGGAIRAPVLTLLGGGVGWIIAVAVFGAGAFIFGYIIAFFSSFMGAAVGLILGSRAKKQRQLLAQVKALPTPGEPVNF